MPEPTIYDEPCLCTACAGRHRDCWTYQLICAYQMILRAAIQSIPPEHFLHSGIGASVAFFVRVCENFIEEEPE